MTAYVKAAEYIQMRHITKDDMPENFDLLADLAGEYLDHLTHDFYQYHKIDDDTWDLRVTKFKRANVHQIAYMASQGVSSTEELKAQPLNVSQTIDGTTVSKSYAAKYSASADGPIPSIISDDAVAALSGVGLLFRGVAHL